METRVLALAEGILKQDRVALGRALSLIESQRPEDIPVRAALLNSLPLRTLSFRIGFTGAPGAGKSTLIDVLGAYLLQAEPEATLAILTVDPSSWRSGGSLLADQTRMRRLSTHPRVFARTFASGGHLGGLHPRIREAVHLCESASFTYIFLESVGTGQSEIELRYVCDFLLYVALPNMGDEVQGLKRGLMEALDGIALNKSDTVSPEVLRRVLFQLETALHLLRPHDSLFVLPVSALREEHIPDLYQALLSHRPPEATLLSQRQAQESYWLERYWQETLAIWLQNSPHGAFYQDLKTRLSQGESLWNLMHAIAHHFGLTP
jgi:LAO/AO transport system kinase